jgi:hypothetical protein
MKTLNFYSNDSGTALEFSIGTSTELLQNIKERALKGEFVVCDFDFDNDVNVWHDENYGQSKFSLELNGVVIKSCKTWNPIAKKLLTLINSNFKHTF